VADSICHFAGIIKDKTDRRLVIGSFYGYILELTDARFGSHALSRVLRCPDIDFLSSPSSYMNSRAPGIDAANMSVLDSIKLHGKLYFTENDNRTYLTRPISECRPDSCKAGTYRGGVWDGPSQPEVSLWVLRSCFARNLTHGVGQWWFDMWGGWFADAAIMADMKAYREIAAVSLYDTNRASVAGVAVIASEESYRYTNPLDPSVSRQNYMNRLPLGLAGTPYDIYDIIDIEALPVHIRAVVFLNIAGRESIAEEYIAAHPEKRYMLTGSDGAGMLATGILRRFYAEAGVHIYSDTDDVIHVCENYIAVHASSAGDKTLRLTKTSKISPLLPDGCAFISNTINVTLRQYETRLYRLDNVIK
jgi:beta-galactosidase